MSDVQTPRQMLDAAWQRAIRLADHPNQTERQKSAHAYIRGVLLSAANCLRDGREDAACQHILSAESAMHVLELWQGENQ